MWILCIVAIYVAKGFAMFVGLITLILLRTLFDYDFDALLCYYNKNSEYYRATGVTRNDILNDKGYAGEFNAYVLSKKIKVPHKTLYNVCVPMPNGSFQEVDAIIITPNNVYVLECKNRAGYFEIDYGKKYWTQYIGNQEHEVPNIYLQNEEHIIAIDNFLLSKKVIDVSLIYLSLVLTDGDLFFNDEVERPDNFCMGNLFYLAKGIEQKEHHSQSKYGDDFMNNVYMALLPYALNGKAAKQSMLNERERRGKNGEIARGNYRYYRFENGVPIVDNLRLALLTDENTLLRKDNVYTQIGFSCDSFYYWFPVPNTTYNEK